MATLPVVDNVYLNCFQVFFFFFLTILIGEKAILQYVMRLEEEILKQAQKILLFSFFHTEANNGIL